jgi:hypothetical protein
MHTTSTDNGDKAKMFKKPKCLKDRNVERPQCLKCGIVPAKGSLMFLEELIHYCSVENIKRQAER